ncbi:hypothetical protein B0T16DRAFT_301255, partial [Cercophora newfieldiana]
KEGFKQLLRRAKERGYVVGDAVKQRFVKNAVKSGRPRVIRELEAKVIIEAITADFDSRYSSTAKITTIAAERLKNIPGGNIPSRRTILHWIKKEGFKNV